VFPGVFHALSTGGEGRPDGLKWSDLVPKRAQGEHKPWTLGDSPIEPV
jgi:hypothetical protein